MEASKTRKPCPGAANTGSRVQVKNFTDILADFSNAMAAAGIVTDDTITADGHLHRIHVEGQRRGSRNAAYILHSDGFPAGWFMDFKTGTTGTWGGRDPLAPHLPNRQDQDKDAA